MMESPTHILIVAQSQDLFLPFIEDLEARQVVLGVCDNLNEAVKYVALHSPQIVMISYNHQDQSVKDAAKIIERRFNVQCVAICEKKSKNTAKILLQSGLKHMLFPPLTADAIFDKVARMMRDKNRGKIKRASVAPQTKGPLKPLFEEGGGRRGSSENLFAAPPPKIERVHDLSVPIRDDKTTSHTESKSWFEEHVIPSAELAVQSLVTSSAEILDTSYVGVPLRTSDFSGMVILTVKSGKDQWAALGENFSKELRRRQGNMGKSCYCGDPVELKLAENEFARVSNACVKLAELGSDGHILMFDLSPDEPKLKASKDKKIMTIDMGDIDLSMALNFNLYIHLPKNRKFYQFARRGRLISAKRIERLNVTDHELFIQRGDLANYRSYFFRNKLLKASLLKSFKAA